MFCLRRQSYVFIAMFILLLGSPLWAREMGIGDAMEVTTRDRLLEAPPRARWQFVGIADPGLPPILRFTVVSDRPTGREAAFVDSLTTSTPENMVIRNSISSRIYDLRFSSLGEGVAAREVAQILQFEMGFESSEARDLANFVMVEPTKDFSVHVYEFLFPKVIPQATREELILLRESEIAQVADKIRAKHGQWYDKRNVLRELFKRELYFTGQQAETLGEHVLLEDNRNRSSLDLIHEFYRMIEVSQRLGADSPLRKAFRQEMLLRKTAKSCPLTITRGAIRK